MVRGSSLAVAWAQAAAAFADGNELRRLVLAVVADEGDEVWRAAEEVRSKVVGGTERERLAAMGDLLPEGADVLEPVGRGLLSAALSHAEFPDDELAGVSMAFAQGEDASSLWSLLVITAAAPGEFDDETIDATVVAFCANPPGSRRERMVAAKCVENLALADAWVPLDHARWLVRFIMAPSVDEFHMDLADELIRALAMRNDGPERLAEITHAIVELPMEHPAVGVFVKRLLPRAWMEHVPAEFADAVFTMALEDEVRILLEDALGFRPGG